MALRLQIGAENIPVANAQMLPDRKQFVIGILGDLPANLVSSFTDGSNWNTPTVAVQSDSSGSWQTILTMQKLAYWNRSEMLDGDTVSRTIQFFVVQE
jgi:hypothetical protein